MKKFLLLLAAVSAYCSASALELTFMLGDHKITPGSTVEFTKFTVDTQDGYKEVTCKPDLYLYSDLYSSKIKVTATCTSGQEIQMCAGGTCRGGASVTKEDVKIQTGEKLFLEFDYIDELDLDQKIPVVTTLFEAEDVTKPETKTQFVLIMDENGASVAEITATKGLRAIEGGIAYKTDYACSLTLSTIAGVNVVSTEVEGEGIVKLPQGLYVYSFGNSSGKIYIR